MENKERDGGILLISCYELGHQPLGIASPLGWLERAGFAPEVMDISVEPFDPEKVARAWFVGISVPMHTALRLGVRLAERVREVNPRCHICFYGLYASLNADFLLEGVADTVIGGEYEAPLLALIEALARGRAAGENPAAVSLEGVAWRGQTAAPVLKRLPFAAPRRDRLPSLERYAQLEEDGRRRPAGYVEASRGCLHHCRHCPIPPVYRGRFFVVPASVVLQDIRQQVAAGATHITFGDADFLNGPGHSLKIVRAMHREFPTVTFDFTAKVEHLLRYRSLLPELRELGCLFIVSAVESLSDTVLTILDKGHTREDVYKVLDIVREAGITLRPTWVPFTPWTTLDDYLEMLRFIEAEGLVHHVDPVQYTVRLLVPPGSLLLTRPEIQPYLGPLDGESFSFRWTHPDRRMDELQQAVSLVVEQAIRAGKDSVEIFEQVRAQAYALRGLKPLPLMLSPHRQRRVPRLTEPWFC
ncbi:MAG TPA: CUAEP/CCAEP-tail radical SAM protein [Blastocatellia bacterium]|nr:CUAEP/CCAEP-tail radical SAM protein [Blastocatellia bacterium]